MRVFGTRSLISVAALASVLSIGMVGARAQTAADAALGMARMMDSANVGISGDELVSALQDAAEAGQPMAMWQLGTMYENGEGVAKDPAKAFGYFSQIANENADTAPKGLEADIVAQSFVKIGDYYRDGLPSAGIKVNLERSHALLLHAASYFGDADAQYRVGELYLQEDGLGLNPLQSARWLSLAAHKGHVRAQAQLGDLLFNGIEDIAPQPIEGLMWLNISHQQAVGTPDDAWVSELFNRAFSVASAEQRTQAMALATQLGPRFSAARH